ncbi:hypothetical protein [Agromyces sp. M3QZ16-3]|uniref:hypothetical protein n=1 Tax=Agromyces sp. M3QZ16-3 TaxID=3447585 RepID=UPI003F6946D1
MTDQPGRDFDPRYDPRFQRGWDGPADAGEPREPEEGRDPAPGPPRVAVPSDDPTDDAGGMTVAAGADVDRGGPQATPLATSEIVAPLPVPGPAPAPASPASAAESEPTDETGPVAASGGAAVPGGPVLQAEADRIMRVAFGVAWGVAALALLIGIWSVSVVVDQDPFGGPGRDSAEMTMRAFAYSAGPALLGSAVVGIAVLTVADGIRRARRPGTRSGRTSATGAR